jgi:hypothetical protein
MMPKNELAPTLVERSIMLRKFYRPGTVIAGDLECISYPYPNDHGGIAVMVREKDNPTTIRPVGIPESDWQKVGTA